MCDHATKSIVEVAYYATIPCDLNSFALGVGELLAGGIEQYKTNCANNNNVPESSNMNNALIPENHDMIQNYCEESYDYSADELDVDISNMFRNESFASLYMMAC